VVTTALNTFDDKSASSDARTLATVLGWTSGLWKRLIADLQRRHGRSWRSGTSSARRDPEEPNERELPNDHVGVDFMKLGLHASEAAILRVDAARQDLFRSRQPAGLVGH
jgi:hypothetical protein